MDKQYIVEMITDFANTKGINVAFSLEITNTLLEALHKLMIHKKTSHLSNNEILFVFRQLFPEPKTLDFLDKINAQTLPLQNEHQIP